MLRWNFDVEHIDVLLGHNVEYTGEGCPFGARVLKRKLPGGGGMPNRREIWLFQGVNMDEID